MSRSLFDKLLSLSCFSHVVLFYAGSGHVVWVRVRFFVRVSHAVEGSFVC
jgi:hypothetical protein